jgi:hypothetical protein
LALFFAIGIILCIGFAISDAKQALLVGIAAPGSLQTSYPEFNTVLRTPPVFRKLLSLAFARAENEQRLTNLRWWRQAIRMIHLRLIPASGDPQIW